MQNEKLELEETEPSIKTSKHNGKLLSIKLLKSEFIWEAEEGMIDYWVDNQEN